MYGTRSERDIAVTRFYTSDRIYDTMKRINQFDAALREAFEKGQHEDGVVFLEKDSNGSIIVCAPNKILASDTDTIKPYRRFLPERMQTISKTEITPINEEIEQILSKYEFNDENATLADIKDCIDILKLIEKCYSFSDKNNNKYYKWNIENHIAILKRLCGANIREELKDKVYCIVVRGRNISRYKNDGKTFSNAPDDGRTDRPLAKQYAEKTAVVQLIKQNGLEKNGWKNAPFWWPVITCPKSTRISIFTPKEQE